MQKKWCAKGIEREVTYNHMSTTNYFNVKTLLETAPTRVSKDRVEYFD